jgi:CRP/FNR family cyclic AMP-dependent transcriptional regulator
MKIESAIVPAADADQNATAESLLTQIASHPFVRGMNADHLLMLAACATPITFQTDQLIFREGDPANRFYLILEGEVALESCVKEWGTTLIQTVGAGEVLGWSWLFPPYYWHFDARALRQTQAIFLYGTPLRERCEQDHNLGYDLMKRTTKVLIQRLQKTRQHLLSVYGAPT